MAAAHQGADPLLIQAAKELLREVFSATDETHARRRMIVGNTPKC